MKLARTVRYIAINVFYNKEDRITVFIIRNTITNDTIRFPMKNPKPLLHDLIAGRQGTDNFGKIKMYVCNKK